MQGRGAPSGHQVGKQPVGESPANGLVESPIKLGGLTPTLKDGPERRIQRKLDPESAVLLWTVAHTASVINEFAVGADGRTPTEKAWGTRGTRALAVFGEKVLYSQC